MKKSTKTKIRRAKPSAKRSAPFAKTPTSKPAVITSLKLNLPRLGAIWPGQGGKFVGLIRGEDKQPDYALVRAIDPKASLKGAYGPTERISAESTLDGMANTQAMAKAGSELAKKALAVKIDGHADFYIPAKDEAAVMLANDADRPGEYHWTSTQSRAFSHYAWVQHFGDGSQNGCHKDHEFPVRLVRRVPIQ